jgi:Protein of unknown function (DUF2924)
VRTRIDIEAALNRLDDLSRDELAKLWEQRYIRPPPKSISRQLLLLSAAFALQAKAYGDLRGQTRKRLTGGTEAAPRVQSADLKPGARLARVWNGRTHHVDVVADGYLWNGRTYRSLTAIASEITGAKWSGPRFFGLVSRSDTQASADVTR